MADPTSPRALERLTPLERQDRAAESCLQLARRMAIDLGIDGPRMGEWMEANKAIVVGDADMIELLAVPISQTQAQMDALLAERAELLRSITTLCAEIRELRQIAIKVRDLLRNGASELRNGTSDKTA